jgi:23S rRNA (cytosine1962-C5)-methyltransferase
MLSCAVDQCGQRKIRAKHPWVAARSIASLPDAESGRLIDVSDETGRFLARGYVEKDSLYPVRILSFVREEIGPAFFERRIAEAAAARRRFIDPASTNVCRMVNEEGDNLSGLAVDLYGEHVLVQYFSRGMEAFADLIVPVLVKLVRPKGIYQLSRMTRSKIYPREPQRAHPTELAWGAEAPGAFCVRENGVQFLVSLEQGAKTGLYLDMRDNRRNVQRYSAGAAVLNAFAYTASFSVYAAIGGARKTVNIDLSRKANEWGKKNFALNGIDPATHLFIADDVFEVMKRCQKRGDLFDMVILDPPTFSKGIKKAYRAQKDYGQLCASAMRLLSPQGILACALNSQELSERWFDERLREAGRIAKKRIRILGRGTQGPDYRVDAAFPEGRYLKFALLKAV